MGREAGWERVGELSHMLQSFRHIYLRGEIEDDDQSTVRWQSDLLLFLKGLLLSCGRSAGDDEGSPWVHFRFEAFCSVLTHSCCDWSSPEAFGCCLMSEFVKLLLQVHSELPVSTAAIVHVLLHRLATIRPGKESKGPFGVLVSGLQEALDNCPAMPGATLEVSIEDCLRRPLPGATWSVRTIPMFVHGVLSLVTRSPRSLCQAVVPLLVRLVAETECQAEGRGPSCSSQTPHIVDAPTNGGSPCVACAAAGAPFDETTNAVAPEERQLRCEANEKRDLVLEGLLRWAVDVHFRRCSRLLQASFHRAVCDGVRQVLDAPSMQTGHVSVPSFPAACRLLLSFVGGLAGDGGLEVALFLQGRCSAELRISLSRLRRISASREIYRRRSSVGVLGLELPMLEGYVGHVCLCKHVSDTAAAGHLLWLSHEALSVFRMLDGEASPKNVGQYMANGAVAAVLLSLCHALALLLTRGRRGKNTADLTVPESAGNVLEIIFDSDARPLGALSRPLAEAAVSVLQGAGYLQLARVDMLLGPSPLLPQQPLNKSGEGASMLEDADGPFTDGFDFRQARVAFKKSWALASAGVNSHVLVMKSEAVRDSADDDVSVEMEGSESDREELDTMRAGVDTENGWERVPDEVTLRVFSFMTPKRVCRLACVDRAWRAMLGVARVWRPLFEARWSLEVLESEDDVVGVAAKLLSIPGSERAGKRKRTRVKSQVVHWQLLEDANNAPPSQDWMALYRDRHKAERVAKGRTTARTNFPWLVCPFLGCVCSLKSEFAVKRHLNTHKRPSKNKRRLATKKCGGRARSTEGGDGKPPARRRQNMAAPEK